MRAGTTRRSFMKRGMTAGAAIGFPMIIPSRVLGAQAPSKKIQVGIIGCGRIAGGMDIPGVWQNQDLATIVALSDPDRKRMNATRDKTRALFAGDLPELKLYPNDADLLSDASVDAVMICTPDHNHAQQCVDAAIAKKDIYVQKPLAMTIPESRMIAGVVSKMGCVFHLGTQQRSEGRSTFGPQFRKAAEYVLNGRIGRVKRVEIGLPTDPVEPKTMPLEQPVPATFDYDRWLGSAPLKPYSELRTHLQGQGDGVDFSRPGWLTIQDYCMGMISGWGSHHIDIAQWGLGMEHTTPVRIRGRADFPKRRLWNVHGKLDVKMEYANGTMLHIADEHVYPNGIRFVGDEGWIFCGRGSVKMLIDDPGAGGKHGYWRPLEASAKKLIEGEVTQKLVRNTGNHHRVWFDSIRSRQPTNTPIAVAHRTTTTCILAYMAMNLKRPLTWDPVVERFVGDEGANAQLSRPERAPYGVLNALKRAGLALLVSGLMGCANVSNHAAEKEDVTVVLQRALSSMPAVYGTQEPDQPDAPANIREPDFAMMRGTRVSLIIAKGEAEGFKPVLYVEPRRGSGVNPADVKTALEEALKKLQAMCPGVRCESFETGFRIVVPRRE